MISDETSPNTFANVRPKTHRKYSDSTITYRNNQTAPLGREHRYFHKYWSYILREGVSGWLEGFVTRVLTAKEYIGWVILLHSETVNTPPGLRTRYASLITSDTEVQFFYPESNSVEVVGIVRKFL